MKNINNYKSIYDEITIYIDDKISDNNKNFVKIENMISIDDFNK